MAHHRFKDKSNREWNAWDVLLSESAIISPKLRGGWVLFESGSEKRRLAPIPVDFAGATVELLQQWCDEATRAKPRRGSSG